MNTLVLTALTLLAQDLAAPPPLPANVVGAAHHGVLAAGEIAWRSTILLGSPPLGDARVRVPLAPPLPADVELHVEGPGSGVERDSAGRAVALVVHPPGLRYAGSTSGLALRRVEVRARQAQGEGEVHLLAPIAKTDAVQRLVLTGATPVRFAPDEGLGLERRIGLLAGVDVDRDERHRLDRWLPVRDSVKAERIYLRANVVAAAGGLTGALEGAPAQRTGVALAAALAFGLIVLLGAGLYRRATREVDLERVDALLEEEFRSLG